MPYSKEEIDRLIEDARKRTEEDRNIAASRPLAICSADLDDLLRKLEVIIGGGVYRITELKAVGVSGDIWDFINRRPS